MYGLINRPHAALGDQAHNAILTNHLRKVLCHHFLL